MDVGRLEVSTWTRHSATEQRWDAVISSRLPPSRLLGSVATTVCCPAFTCFVSTSRRLLVTAQWETAVFEVSPANESDTRLRVRFGYPIKMKANGGQLCHDMVCSELDKIGETSSKPLGDCLSAVLHKLQENNVISWTTVY